MCLQTLKGCLFTMFDSIEWWYNMSPHAYISAHFCTREQLLICYMCTILTGFFRVKNKSFEKHFACDGDTKFSLNTPSSFMCLHVILQNIAEYTKNIQKQVNVWEALSLLVLSFFYQTIKQAYIWKAVYCNWS